jgi:transposase
MIKKVCGLDVHKDTIFCAIYDGKKTSEVKEYKTLAPDISRLSEYLQSEGVEEVAMESTASYWVPVWNILESVDFKLHLVNPYLIKQMPGRKSDVKDAQWIATLLHKGLIRSSLVPCHKIRELRTYSRKHMRLQQKRTSILQEIEKNLELCCIRITSFASHIHSRTVMKIVDHIIAGETDKEVFLSLVH